MITVRCVLDAKAELGEGPVWDGVARRLYWVDISGRVIHRYDPESGSDEVWRTPEDVASVAVRRGGGLVCAMRSGFCLFDLDTGKLTPINDPEPHLPDNRLNDGRCDRQGRFWAGSLNAAKPVAGLYRLDENLGCTLMVSNIRISNSLCWSPDGRTMYYGDTLERTIWAWDYDLETGDITNRRVFVEIPPDDGYPDGATVDEDGYVWVAHWDGWRLTRFDPQGGVAQVVVMPVQRPTCPMFGGPNLETLFVTSAGGSFTQDELEEQPLAGGVFALEPGVRGVPEASFAG